MREAKVSQRLLFQCREKCSCQGIIGALRQALRCRKVNAGLEAAEQNQRRKGPGKLTCTL